MLDLDASNCRARSNSGESIDVELQGQSACSFAESLADFLRTCGMNAQNIDSIVNAERDTNSDDQYSSAVAGVLGRVLASVASELERFRAGIPEETSPIQLWPHHFDVSMIWLPGEKISGQDPSNEEYSDKQMNFGFAFGDAGIPEPYFYVTAYPTPEGLSDLELPAGAEWKADGFTGVVVPYAEVAGCADPSRYLQDLWATVLNAGRDRMLSGKA